MTNAKSVKLDFNIRMIIASIIMLLFVISDLVFDFIFNFSTSDYIAFVFTLLASIITFVATYKVKKREITSTFNKTTAFIKSNFNNWQVIFSALDIICGIISIVSGLVIIGGVFKFVKIGYLIVKFIVVTNKSKTVAKSISKFSLLWTACRLIWKSNNKKENKAVKTTKLSKIQIASIIGAVVGIVFAIVSAFVPQIQIAGDMVYNVCISLGIETLSAFAGTFKGYAEKTEEEIAKAKAKQEEKENALKEAELEKAKAIVEQYENAKAIVEEAENSEKQ